MAPTAAPLAQSDSKTRFMNRLGLNEGNKMHRYLYSLMKTEAADGWTRMTANREALMEGLKDDPNVEPPYTFSQLDEAAVHKEILHIYETARPETKIMYGLGHDRDGEIEENWIIRWLLWHVFRYRDERNSGSNRRRTQSTSPNVALEDDAVLEDIAATPEISQTAHNESSEVIITAEHVTPSRYWDPVREDFRS